MIACNRIELPTYAIPRFILQKIKVYGKQNLQHIPYIIRYSVTVLIDFQGREVVMGLGRIQVLVRFG